MREIKQELYGETSGVKEEVLKELESCYLLEVEGTSLISEELARKMAWVSELLGREVAVYINRRGKVVAVALGDHNKVVLPHFEGRRKTKRLAGVRLVHTHPGGSGMLSGVDWAALAALQFDCIAAIGVQDGKANDIYAGFCPPGREFSAEACLIKGPLRLADLEQFNLLETIEAIEKQARSAGAAQPAVIEAAERVVVVALALPPEKNGELPPEESLAELVQLVKAAGATVVGSFMQKKSRIDGTYFIGKGFAGQLSLQLQELRANVLVVDHELTGTQMRNLEQLTGVRVLDRTAVILDIFAQRAQTREGKLQVELAQLRYRLPRLMGQGGALSRLAGGIGTRGPGETKLETDRRHIRRRIKEIEEQLVEVERRRYVQRHGRKDIPAVALVGYTNAGKSTLRFRLLQSVGSQEANWELEDRGTDRLFATLDPTLRGITLPGGQEVLVADTVGFIHKLPHQFVSAFRATLEEVQEADLLLHVIDASNPRWEEQKKTVEEVLAELGVAERPRINVLNKIDLLASGASLLPLPDGNPWVSISAAQGTGLEQLLLEMANLLQQDSRQVQLFIPYPQAGVLNELYKTVQVISVNYREDAIVVDAVVSNDKIGRYQPYLDIN
ncbi:MAG: GTPase HflX [Bacillota bacterium]